MRVWAVTVAILLAPVLSGSAVADDPLHLLPPVPPLPDAGGFTGQGLPEPNPECVTAVADPTSPGATYAQPVTTEIETGLIVALDAQGEAGIFAVLLVRPAQCLDEDPRSALIHPLLGDPPVLEFPMLP